RMFRIVGELLHPIAQLRHMHAQVLRSLHIGHASLLDQAHSLKLELAGKLPSLHDPPPAPSKHLTRCLRNRVQARPSLPGTSVPVLGFGSQSRGERSRIDAPPFPRRPPARLAEPVFETAKKEKSDGKDFFLSDKNCSSTGH